MKYHTILKPERSTYRSLFSEFESTLVHFETSLTTPNLFRNIIVPARTNFFQLASKKKIFLHFISIISLKTDSQILNGSSIFLSKKLGEYSGNASGIVLLKCEISLLRCEENMISNLGKSKFQK